MAAVIHSNLPLTHSSLPDPSSTSSTLHGSLNHDSHHDIHRIQSHSRFQIDPSIDIERSNYPISQMNIPQTIQLTAEPHPSVQASYQHLLHSTSSSTSAQHLISLPQVQEHACSTGSPSCQTPPEELLSFISSCPPSQTLPTRPQELPSIQLTRPASPHLPVNSFPLPRSLQGIYQSILNSNSTTDPGSNVILGCHNIQSSNTKLVPLPPISPPVSIKTRAKVISSCNMKETKLFVGSSLLDPSDQAKAPTPMSSYVYETATSVPKVVEQVAPPNSISSKSDGPHSSVVLPQRSRPPNSQRSRAIVKTVNMNRSTTPHNDRHHSKAWKRRLSDVRFELDQISSSPSKAAPKLLNIFIKFRTTSLISDLAHFSTIPLDGRIEILSAIKCCASQEFYNLWMCEKYGLELIQSWLVEAVLYDQALTLSLTGVAATDLSSQHDRISFYILEMLDKVPFTTQILRLYQFGKYVLRINLGNSSIKFSPNVIDLSRALESKWRKMIRESKKKIAINSETETHTDFNFTHNPRPSVIDPPPLKPELPEAITDPPPRDSLKRQEHPSFVNTEAKKRKIFVQAHPTNSQTGPDLFGRAEKYKISTFANVKIAKNPVRIDPSAGTSNVRDSFTQAMDLLKNKNNNDLMALDDLSDPIVNPNVIVKNSCKPAKRVRFRPANELCDIRIVERLTYDGEAHEIAPWIDEQARRIDGYEGRYLHHMDALGAKMPWQTPHEVVLTSETIHNLETSPLISGAAILQEEREKRLVEVRYENVDEIPATANEPEEDLAKSSFDDNNHELGPESFPRSMKLSRELILDAEVSQLIAQVHVGNAQDAPFTTDETVATLLDRLEADSNKLLGIPKPTLLPANISTPIESTKSTDVSDSLILAMDSSTSKSFGTVPLEPHPVITLHQSTADLEDPASRHTVDLTHSYYDREDSRSFNKRIRKKKKKPESKFGRSRTPCRWGSDCHFGKQCHFKHDWS